MTAVAFRPPWPWPSDGTVALRLWSMADLDQVVDACQDPEILRWTLVPRPYTRQDARTFLRGVPDGWRQGTAASYCICPPVEPDRVLGAIGLFPRPTRIGVAGYWVRREARGDHVATRALRLLATWAFAHTDLARLELTVIVGNEASARVAENAGFEREGLLRAAIDQRGTRRDGWLYARLPSDPEPPPGPDEPGPSAAAPET